MFAFIFLVLSFVAGVFLFDWLDNKTSFFNFRFLVFSSGVGLTVSGYAVLFLALVLKSLFGGLVIFSVFGLVLACLFLKKIVSILKRRLVVSGVFSPGDIFIFLIVAVVVVLSLQSMLFDPSITSSGETVSFPFGILKGWGDGAYHLNMVERLATAEPFVLDQPIAGGRVLSYPVLVNFLSAILKFGGLPLPVAWHLPTTVFCFGLVFGLFQLGKKFLKKNFLAATFVFLVLFGAGLGYFQFFRETQKEAPKLGWADSFFNNFFEPKYEYSHLDVRTGGKPSEKNLPENIVWIVPAISFFSHQRSFVLGGFLGALFLFGFAGTFNWRYLLVLGLMPLAHSHSFLALAVLSFALIVFSGNFRNAFNKFSCLAGLVALPQLVFIYLSLKLNGSYGIVPWFGWMTCTHRADPFICDPGVPGTDSSFWWFWLKNFGPIFVVWLAAVFLYLFFKKEDGRAKLSLASVLLFVLPNLFLFQPWEFDNNKIIFWWWLLAILLSLSLFDEKAKSPEISNTKSQISNRFQILNAETKISKKLPLVINYSLLVIFVFGSSFAGIIDVVGRLQSGMAIGKNIRNFGYYGEEEVKVSNWIKQNTKPNDIFLTSSSPTQFVPMLSGRPIYLGFTGWLWTQGGNSVVFERKTKISEFAHSGNTGKLCLDGVRYWLADQPFFKEYPSSESRVSAAGEVVFELGSEKILKLDCGN